MTYYVGNNVPAKLLLTTIYKDTMQGKATPNMRIIPPDSNDSWSCIPWLKNSTGLLLKKPPTAVFSLSSFCPSRRSVLSCIDGSLLSPGRVRTLGKRELPSPAPEIFHGCALQLVVGRYHKGIFFMLLRQPHFAVVDITIGYWCADWVPAFLSESRLSHPTRRKLWASFHSGLTLPDVAALSVQPLFAYYVRVQRVQRFSSAVTILFSQSKQRPFKSCILHASIRRRRSKSASLGGTHISNLLTLLQVNGWRQTCQSVRVLSGVDQLRHRRTNSHC